MSPVIQVNDKAFFACQDKFVLRSRRDLEEGSPDFMAEVSNSNGFKRICTVGETKTDNQVKGKTSEQMYDLLSSQSATERLKCSWTAGQVTTYMVSFFAS